MPAKKGETEKVLDHYRVMYHYFDGNEVIMRTYIFDNESEAMQYANEIASKDDVLVLLCNVYEMYKLVRGDKWRSKWTTKTLLHDATPNQNRCDAMYKYFRDVYKKYKR